MIHQWICSHKEKDVLQIGGSNEESHIGCSVGENVEHSMFTSGKFEHSSVRIPHWAIYLILYRRDVFFEKKRFSKVYNVNVSANEEGANISRKALPSYSLTISRNVSLTYPLMASPPHQKCSLQLVEGQLL